MYKIMNSKIESLVIIIVAIIIIVAGITLENSIYRLIFPFAIIGCFLEVLSLRKRNRREARLNQANTSTIDENQINKYLYGSFLFSFIGLFFFGIPSIFGLYFVYKAHKILADKGDCPKRIKFLICTGFIFNILTILIVIFLYGIMPYQVGG